MLIHCVSSFKESQVNGLLGYMGQSRASRPREVILWGAQGQAQRSRAQPGAQEVPSAPQEALLGWAGAGALAQAAQRGAGGSSLGISSSRLDVGLGPLLGVALLEQGWHHRDLQLPDTTSHVGLPYLISTASVPQRHPQPLSLSVWHLRAPKNLQGPSLCTDTVLVLSEHTACQMEIKLSSRAVGKDGNML